MNRTSRTMIAAVAIAASLLAACSAGADTAGDDADAETTTTAATEPAGSSGEGTDGPQQSGTSTPSTPSTSAPPPSANESAPEFQTVEVTAGAPGMGYAYGASLAALVADPEQDQTTMTVDWGDGATEEFGLAGFISGVPPDYPAAGTYRVTAPAYDEAGNSTTTTDLVQIREPQELGQ